MPYLLFNWRNSLWLKYIEDILDKIRTSLFVSVFIALYINYVKLPDDEKKWKLFLHIKLVRFLEKSRMDNDFLVFFWETGRYTRSVTIPALSKSSNAKNEYIKMEILVLEPTDFP